MEPKEPQSTLLQQNKSKRNKSSIDQGWAWVVMFASFIIMVLSMGYVRTFGILYVEFEERFGASATMTSSTMGFRSVVQSISAFLVHGVVLEFVSVRVVIIFGGFIYGLSVLLKVFATNMSYVILTECIFAGMAHGIVFSPPFVMMSQYFRKHRSFATSLATCGSSLGLMVFAPVLRYLLDQEGYQGALLIYGAILLNIIPCGCLLRPLKPHEIQFNEELPPTKQDMQISSSGSIDKEMTVIASSSLNMEEGENPFEPDQLGSNKQSRLSSVRLALFKMLKAFDFQLFKDLRFLVIMGYTFFGGVGSSVGGLLLPPLCKEMGVSNDESSQLLIILAVVDFVSRFFVGLIADRNWIKKQNIVLITLVIIGTACHCTRFCASFDAFVVLTVVLGLFSGAFYALLSVTIIDILGLSKLSTVLGFVQLYGGLSSVLMYPIFGALRDTTGTYIASYHFVGGCAYLAALMLALEPLASQPYKQTSSKAIKSNPIVKPDL
ncbi:hypothetical protein LOTGIDRAFT_155139 [Lottia gigantea]|uniref:Major facilitator superfamily (MFS) profile domain-containing protein n=1 Tax=Lottia gigantea TaxID=225164 RepID=V3ZMV4_LOTGI|nr:hypothetical protein LOTGIDRAFT_155139 [Lottia gigantea]ESO85647.1 hypothetical protein LOTGIDRAFT_155139 [Lottia gigantea]